MDCAKAQSAPKGEVEMGKVEMGRYLRSGQTPLPYYGRNRGLATEWCGKEIKKASRPGMATEKKRKKTTTMSKILEEYRKEMYQEGFEEGFKEGLQEADIEIATRMLVDGKLRLEEIVEYTGLEMAEVEELARKMSTQECEK